MSFYPSEIDAYFRAPQHAGRLEKANATGVAASFSCGSAVRVALLIDTETKTIADARFTSNGCGYAVAAAEVVATALAGRKTSDFHGDLRGELIRELESKLGAAKASNDCYGLAIEAARLALDDFRVRAAAGFGGDDALVCSCFGVGELAILDAIAQGAETVDDVGDQCRAGQGCGSCRMLIDEIIDRIDTP